MNIEKTREYLKNYNNCIEYCGLTNNEKENNDEIQDCLQDINNNFNKNGEYELCKKLDNVECTIIKEKSFHKFLEYILNLIEFLYSIRTKYSNKYDDHIILLLGYINIKKVFNIDLNDLECIKYPGNNTFQMGFPNNLKKYLEIMKLLYKVRILKNTNLNGTLEEYSEFTGDYQPWCRTITTFLNIYGINIIPKDGIPAIENIKKYGSFLKNKDKNILFFEKLKDKLNNKKFYKDLHEFISKTQQRKKNVQSLKKAKSYNLNNVSIVPKISILKRAVSAPKQTIKKSRSRTHSRLSNKLKKTKTKAKTKAKSATFNKSKKRKSKTKKAKSYS